MSRPSLKQIAYNTIKEKILSCEYEPSSFFNEEALCEELQMSRTPVRDALSRMEQENLIQIVPKKGFFIAPMSITEINMVFEGRLLLEPYIIINYCQHLSDETLQEMQSLLSLEKDNIHKKDMAIYQADHSFHMCLINQCTNHYFLRLYDNLHNQNNRLRVLSGRSSNDRLKMTLDEHMRIFTELTKRNLEQAASYMRDHLINSKEASFQSFITNHPYL